MRSRASVMSFTLLSGVLLMGSILLLMQNPAYHFSSHDLSDAIWSPDDTSYKQLIFHYSLLPRLAVSLLAGAALGLAGFIFQQVLRNPLAEPATLGISAGAWLAMVVMGLWFPFALAAGREWIAFGGSAVTLMLVMLLAKGRGLSPLSLILGGMVVTLFCSSASSMMMLFNHAALMDLFIWQTGSLEQNNWDTAQWLALQMGIVTLLIIATSRPLQLLSMNEQTAHSVGLTVRYFRLLLLLIAAWLSSMVVSRVGVISFIGLAAPAAVRLCGIHRQSVRLFLVPLTGALMLSFTDLLVQTLSQYVGVTIPTGLATAITGAPLLLLLIPHLRERQLSSSSSASSFSLLRVRSPWWLMAFLLLLLIILIWIALAFGRMPEGWAFSQRDQFRQLLTWRAPRVMAAVAAGAMLAVAGTLMQRMTTNAMASPEVLGISSGAAFGVVVLFMFTQTSSPAWMLFAATSGAMATMILMIVISRKSSFSPERVLLTGIATGTACNTFSTLYIASGDDRSLLLMNWMAGSTYRVTSPEAYVAIVILLAALAILPLLVRWLDSFPLGETVMRATGMPVGRSRLLIILLTAILCASATLLTGPLSFVGLLAPHIVVMMGLQRGVTRLIASALMGAILLLFADWVGRNLLYPFQIPAGLCATFIGSPYFMWMMRRRGR
ncbi:Fe(3+)-hydroxamate ABC transporter permease FhuB [Rahnella aquatilis]|uniref:ABC-type Fe3+-siderophore transport system, permease component n=1 Tax=Rahnella aquatilis (strain ATCC 33071 / DSM 4594 / JCM 1683 / NBRC 105701 / NCIMB 13365 / CIP 78.65) TaxID=745277 RepID=H2IW88_RAHAC|nr:Fe(3+)-hydroxamate ABC transporter permease FhuB [Rahnella aquatilis]AEX51820.1 ABC-type Fe3+-siderophore transport system, permease component [Rahnella aquatilis CIP 78.65 = ATCC 33071]